MAALRFLLPASLLTLALVLGGCDRASQASATQAAQAAAAAEAAQQKLAESEKMLASKGDALALSNEARDAAQQRLAQVTAQLAERDAQLRAVQAELDAAKRRDAFAFAEARAHQQQGRNIIAIDGYEKFLKAYPNSDFAPLATSAIAELQAQAQRDQQRWAAMKDPKAKEREMQTLFRDGLLTPKELAPWIKKKTRAQVIALLGKPSHLSPAAPRSATTTRSPTQPRAAAPCSSSASMPISSPRCAPSTPGSASSHDRRRLAFRQKIRYRIKA
jgi:hypothetical protein